MALTADQLAELRLMIDEADGSGGWSDDILLALAEPPPYDLRAIAARVWEMKAAKYVELASVSESGSSRSLGEIFSHAKQMADYFKKPATDTSSPAAPRSMRMVRPTREA